MESKQLLPTQVARLAAAWAELLPANTRAAAWDRLNVRPSKNVDLGTTVMLPLSTMLGVEMGCEVSALGKVCVCGVGGGVDTCNPCSQK